jgi:putative redox protein
MQAKVTWHTGLTFTGSADTGFNVPLGAHPSVGGNNDGFRPMELLATGLAGCTGMDVISILNKKRERVTHFEVKVDTVQAADHPKVFTRAVIEYHVAGQQISEESVRRAIELSAVRYCPAQAMFSKIMPLELKYFIYETGEGSERTLVRSGVWSESTQI